MHAPTWKNQRERKRKAEGLAGKSARRSTGILRYAIPYTRVSADCSLVSFPWQALPPLSLPCVSGYALTEYSTSQNMEIHKLKGTSTENTSAINWLRMKHESDRVSTNTQFGLIIAFQLALHLFQWIYTGHLPDSTVRVKEVWLHKSKSLGLLQDLKATNEKSQGGVYWNNVVVKEFA